MGRREQKKGGFEIHPMEWGKETFPRVSPVHPKIFFVAPSAPQEKFTAISSPLKRFSPPTAAQITLTLPIL